MKLSYYTSKVLMGVSISALLSGAALAQEINHGNFSDFFNYKDGIWSLDSKENIELKISPSDIQSYYGGENNDKPINEFNIKTSGVLTIGSDSDWIDVGSTSTNEAKYDLYSVNLEAKEIILNSDRATLEANKAFNIKGNVTLKGSSPITNDNISNEELDRPSLDVWNGYGEKDGYMSIQGNLNVNNSFIGIFDANKKGGLISVDGDVNIKDSAIGISTNSVSNLGINNYVAIKTTGSFNQDIDKNLVTALYTKDITSMLETSNLLPKNVFFEDTDLAQFTDYKLSVSNDGKSLLISGGANENVRDLSKILKSEIDIRKEALDTFENIKKNIEYDEEYNKNSYQKPGYIGDDAMLEAIAQAEKELQEQIKKLEQQIQDIQDNGGKFDGSDLVENMKDVSLENKNLAVNMLNSILDSKLSNDAIAALTLDTTGKNLNTLTTNTKASAKAIVNNAQNSSVNSSIGVANDLAIGTRIAKLSNPYQDKALVEKFATTHIAALASDVYNYYGNSSFNNSFWGNVFGGANIIDGDSGALYGFTLGADRKINDNALLGFYFTYADSTIKDGVMEQKSDNYQFGIYSLINPNDQWEINLRAYGQISPTDQSVVMLNDSNKADFDSKFFGLSANAGRIFNPNSSSLFIKPFAGINYYYAHTPSYKESGMFAKDVQSMTNNSISLELGAEFRKYMSETSYLFITPKIEQYVMNNGDDYVAGFVGSNSNFIIKGNDKKKTYGQIIIGGNVDISEQFSLNAGIGAKQILAGKTDGKNETYVSGQVGFKYKF
ncbi:autotransporter domain-containing protein [Campylobacter lari]|uniref:autotransporter outer membrane beta-barrel domain-containing protein n=1 Tax=Campylobacter lari TaxID=201 RepID=UPI001417B0A7|nr:autotransporter domain-containing protein [Campylobacter lari]EAI4827175.1 autotransporter domain-containing protein [Campylobacter lari]EAJ6177141.1 autotransporter domain-containing protein [Campylobacter lari]EAK3645715.1 autotransporter domain-containing protein [Campylobacter lari]EKK0830032.1 autotransporter domain-containing protein [Campylobacter lari]MCV3474539.1 autotransporter domain-containing protein [Campylobacter lari]